MNIQGKRIIKALLYEKRKRQCGSKTNVELNRPKLLMVYKLNYDKCEATKLLMAYKLN